MKKLYSFIFILALSAKTFSQCTPAIPGTSVVINSTQTTGFGGSDIWVCPGVTETSNGGSNTIYLEVGATIMAGGGSNTIYCPAGATVNISSGSNNIYYVNTVDLVSTGGGPNLFPCTSINYNYSNAPSPGCSQTTGINVVKIEQTFSLFPNPSNGNFTINNPGELNATVKIYNSLGEEVFSQTLNSKQETVNLSSLPKGIYFVQIAGSNNLFSQKIVVE